jgi:hypothetical protein
MTFNDNIDPCFATTLGSLLKVKNILMLYFLQVNQFAYT